MSRSQNKRQVPSNLLCITLFSMKVGNNHQGGKWFWALVASSSMNLNDICTDAFVL